MARHDSHSTLGSSGRVISTLDQRQQQFSRFVRLSRAVESEFGIREKRWRHRYGRLAMCGFAHKARNRWLDHHKVRVTFRRLRLQLAGDRVGDGARHSVDLGHSRPVVVVGVRRLLPLGTT